MDSGLSSAKDRRRDLQSSSRDIQQYLNDEIYSIARFASPRLALLLSHCSSTEIVGWLIVERPSSRGYTVNWTAAPRAYSPHAVRSTKSRLPQLRRAGDNCRGTGSSLSLFLSDLFIVCEAGRSSLYTLGARYSVSSRRARLQMPCVSACVRAPHLSNAHILKNERLPPPALIESSIALGNFATRMCWPPRLLFGPTVNRIFNLLSSLPRYNYYSRRKIFEI